MNEHLPLIEIADGIISVRFAESVTEQLLDVTCVIDYTDFGDVVGVEILDWRHQLSGGQIDAPSDSGLPRWSYDDEIDALYIHTTDGGGQNQQRTTAAVKLDASRRVVTVEIPLPSPTTR